MITLTPGKFKKLLLNNKLPKKSITIDGDLNLTNCTGLKALPNGLRVDGDLNIANCTGLTALPDGLRVGGWLDLTNCTSIKSFYNLTIKGEVFADETVINNIPFNELPLYINVPFETKTKELYLNRIK